MTYVCLINVHYLIDMYIKRCLRHTNRSWFSAWQEQYEMKTFVVLALALTATQALNYDQEWELFKAKYERNYLSTPEVWHS